MKAFLFGIFASFLASSAYADRPTPDPACSQYKFAGYFEKPNQAGISYILKNCGHLNFNELNATRIPEHYSMIEVSVVQLALIQNWPDVLDTLLKMPNVNPLLADQWGRSPLFYTQSSLPLLQRLLADPRFNPNAALDKEGRLLILEAIAKDDAERIRYLLSLPALDLNLQNKYGGTVLFSILARDSAAFRPIRLLVLQDARLRFSPSYLFDAVDRKDAQDIDDLLLYGRMDVNQAFKGQTLLERAVITKNLLMVKHLVEKYQAEIDANALQRAYADPQPELFQYLLTHPSLKTASVYPVLGMALKDGKSEVVRQIASRPDLDANLLSGDFLRAAWQGRLDVVKFFLNRGEFDLRRDYLGGKAVKHVISSREAQEDSRRSIFSMLAARPELDLSQLDGGGENLSHWLAYSTSARRALWQDYLAKLKTLRLDLNLKNKQGFTPLCLIARGANPPYSNVDSSYFDYLGNHPEVDVNLHCGTRSPWLHAVAARQISAANFLAGLSRFQREKIGEVNAGAPAPLEIVAKHRAWDAFQILASRPELNLNFQTYGENGRNREPLIQLAFKYILQKEEEGSARSIFAALLADPRLQRDVLPTIQSQHGCRLQHYAVQADRMDLLEELLKHPQTDIYAEGSCYPVWGKYNLLELAVQYNRLPMVQRLYPAYPKLMKEDGSAYILAHRQAYLELLEYFLRQGYVAKVNEGAPEGAMPTVGHFISRLNLGMLKFILGIPSLEMNREYAYYYATNRLVYVQGPLGQAAFLRWPEGVEAILADKRLKDPQVSDAMLTLLQSQGERTAPSFENIFLQIFRHKLFNANYKSCDTCSPLLSEMISAQVPAKLIDLLLAVKKIDLRKSLSQTIYREDKATFDKLLAHPNYDPNAERDGVWLAESKKRDWYNAWVKHKKALPGKQGDALIYHLTHNGWNEELLAALPDYNGDWLETSPWRAAYALMQTDPVAGKKMLIQILTMKNAPSAQKLGSILESAIRSGDEDLTLSLLMQIKNWPLNDLEYEEGGFLDLRDGVLCYSLQYNMPRVFEWTLRQKGVLIAGEYWDVLSDSLSREHGFSYYERAMALRGKDFSEANLKHAMGTAAQKQNLEIATLVVDRLLPAIKDWAEMAKHILGYAILANRQDLATKLIQVDRASHYAWVQVGDTPVQLWAARNGRIDLLELLHKVAKLDVNESFHYPERTTALIEAVKARRKDVVEYLVLDPGLRKWQQDDNRMTAIDWAASLGFQELVDLLK